MKNIKLYLEGLNCASCASKIEDKVNKMDKVNEATFNFSTKLLVIEPKDIQYEEEIIAKAKEIIVDLEPHVKVINKAKAIKKVNSGHVIRKSSTDIKYTTKKVNSCSDSDCKCGDDHGANQNHTHINNNEHEQHNHDHNHGEFNNSKKIKFVIAIILFILGLTLKLDVVFEFVIFLCSYVLVGGEVVLTAFKNIIRGKVFDENFLMAIATIGAFCIGDFPEGVAVMIFYQIGEMFQDYAVNKSRKSISSLMDIRPDYANILVNGKEEKVDPESVNIGDIIIVRPGEKVPLDGIVVEGVGSLDTAALTGESLPKDVVEGQDVLAGCINRSGVLKIKVTKDFGESTVSKILDLVENAGNKKASTEKFISKFARYYTPIVVLCAVALAIIPPIVLQQYNFSEWIYRALVFLVVSCPCALVVSIPLGFFGGIGTASRNGVLIKGGNYLEALNNVETIVFDKTGTLTKGIFKVTKIESLDKNKDYLLRLAAHAEYYSNHPIAKSIVNEFNGEINKNLIKNYEEVAGKGIKVNIEDKTTLAGNARLMEDNNISFKNCNELGTVVHFAQEDRYIGYIVISDEIKDDSKETIKELKKYGVKEVIMLTGDNKKVGETIGKELGIDKTYCELLPHDKVEKLEEILSEKSPKGKIMFVGDGINDAPVLARADIGVAMGGVGSDAAIEAADVVIMKDEPSKILTSLRVAKITNNIVWQNIIFAFGVKIIILILGAFGVATMWEAVFGDVGVALIAIINSSRILKKKF